MQKHNILQLKSQVRQLPKGYVDFVLSRGKIEGEVVTLDAQAINQVREKFAHGGTPGVFSVSMLTITKPYHPRGFIDYVLANSKVKGDLAILNYEAFKDIRGKFPLKDRPVVIQRGPAPKLRIASRESRQHGAAAHNGKPQGAGATPRPDPQRDFLLSRAKVLDGFFVLDQETFKEFKNKFHNPNEIKISDWLFKGPFKNRPKGYLEYALARGRKEGDLLIWDRKVFADIQQKFPESKTFNITNLKQSAPRRPKGFVEFVLAHGKIEGGEVKMEPDELKLLNERFPAHFLPTPIDPTPMVMAANFAGAMKDWAKAGFKTVTRKLYETRVATCDACPHWDAEARGGMGKCGICGCSRLKLWLATSKCPDKPPRW